MSAEDQLRQPPPAQLAVQLTPPAAPFRASLLSRGVPVEVACSRRCTARVRIRVGRRTVGTLQVRLRAGRAKPLVLRIRRDRRAALRGRTVFVQVIATAGPTLRATAVTRLAVTRR